MKKSTDKIAEIREKYKKLNAKTRFAMHMAEVLDLGFSSVRNHHLGGKWRIPEEYHNDYLRELDKKLEKQGV